MTGWQPMSRPWRATPIRAYCHKILIKISFPKTGEGAGHVVVFFIDRRVVIGCRAALLRPGRALRRALRCRDRRLVLALRYYGTNPYGFRALKANLATN